VNWRYTGKTYFSPDDSPLNTQSGYSLLDARLAYEIKGLSRLGTANIHQVLYGDPRTFGIEASYHF
jgi:hypothetical protein